MSIILSPSILAANFANLEKDIRQIENSSVEYLHMDVMDGNFVNNISIGMPVIQRLRKITNIVFDTHLMVSEPERYINDFALVGSDIITIHYESTDRLEECLQLIRFSKKKSCIAIRPETPIEVLYEYAHRVDMILIMTVKPGFSAQPLIKDCLLKVKKLKQFVDDNNLKLDIQVDGGIKISNVDKVIDSGANVIVAGSGIFCGNIEERCREFKDKFLEYENK